LKFANILFHIPHKKEKGFVMMDEDYLEDRDFTVKIADFGFAREYTGML
jgi:hypothetical protein